MSINNILVIEKDVDWQNIYKDTLPKHFPGVIVQTADDLGTAVMAMYQQPFDLYITHFPYVPDTTKREKEDSLRRRIDMLREIHADAQIALVTGRTGLESLTTELRIGYFLKQSRTLFTNIAVQYQG